MKVLHTAGLVLRRNNKILLAFSRNKKAFYLPGGKVDAGETAITALLREIEEELSLQLDAGKLSFLIHISAPAFGENEMLMEQDCYVYEDYDLSIQPSSEIEMVQWFSEDEYLSQEHLVPGVLILFEWLRSVP
ncbi:MAG: NUDIX domain-containing protein [Bacteroidota bacterium]|nr:NUDIX domain-containing protein [Bacteroidota bacterium]